MTVMGALPHIDVAECSFLGSPEDRSTQLCGHGLKASQAVPRDKGLLRTGTFA